MYMHSYGIEGWEVDSWERWFCLGIRLSTQLSFSWTVFPTFLESIKLRVVHLPVTPTMTGTRKRKSWPRYPWSALESPKHWPLPPEAKSPSNATRSRGNPMGFTVKWDIFRITQRSTVSESWFLSFVPNSIKTDAVGFPTRDALGL